MYRKGYMRIRRRYKSDSGLGSRPGRYLYQPHLRSVDSYAEYWGFGIPRVVVAAILSFICGLVLSLGSIAEPAKVGSPGSLAHGGTWPSAAGSGSIGPSGPVLSLDVDITDDPGDEVVTSHWISPLEGYLELHGKVAQGVARSGYRLLALVDAGPIIELEKVVFDYDSDSGSGNEDGRAPSGGPGLPDESGQVGGTAPMWATLILAKAGYDQSAGAMSRTTVSTANAWNGRMLVEVWSATTCSEAVWNLSWGSAESVMANSWRWGLGRERALRDFAGLGGDLPVMAAKGLDLGSGNWVRLGSSSAVEFVSGPVPSVIMKSLHECHSYSEKDDAFKLISCREVAQTFCWSDRWSAFIIGEGTVGREGAIGMEYPGADDGTKIHPGTDLAILESERKCVEGLVFGPPFLLRVKLPDGRRCFVNEDAVLTSGLESVV